MYLRLLVALLSCLLFIPFVRADESAHFRVPDGFRVTLYADDDLAHDIFAMTLDSRGRVVVAGRHYVKILHDDTGNGRADRATLFADTPKDGARGLFFDGSDLICTGDNALSRYRDQNGDDVADGPPEILVEIKQTGGHTSNGVVKGPDGWYYLACGNDAGVLAKHVTDPASPVKNPHQGTVYRCSPDGKRGQVVADGFRNPYDLDFTPDGEILLVDADGERDQYMPWYSPTRLFDVASGMHHGWILPGWVRSWNRPPWFFDNVERMVEIGRGSPTGAVIYRHRQFPSRYAGAMFSCCWSLGRIYCFRPTRDGATYVSDIETFLEPAGNAGFAPVAIAVGPAGEMYVAIGGRGTRGSVYRIDYIGKSHPSTPIQSDRERVLAADQPLVSWSRAQWEPIARRLGAEVFVQAVGDDSIPIDQRIRAIEILTELFNGIPPRTAEAIASGPDTRLKARLAWSLGRRHSFDDRERILAQLTHDSSPVVQRHAWEALLELPTLTHSIAEADWSAVRDPRPRRVRAVALLVSARVDDVSRLGPDHAQNPLATLWRKARRDGLSHADFVTAIHAFDATDETARKKEAVRLLQLTLGDLRVEPTEPDVYAGYMANDPLPPDHPGLDQVVATLVAALPSGDAELDREIARLLGMLGRGHDGLPEKLAAVWSEASTVEDDIHNLIVLSRLPGSRTSIVTRSTAKALTNLHIKMDRGQMHASRFWPQRVGNTFRELLRRDPALASEVIASASFGHPAHALFVRVLKPAERRAGTRRLVKQLGNAPSDEWNTDLVRLMGELPVKEGRPLLHRAWDNPSLGDVVATTLAETPRPEDRDILIEALKFGQPATVGIVAQALPQLEGEATPGEIVAALNAFRPLAREKQYVSVCRSLDVLLASWTGHAPSPEQETPSRMYERWSRWAEESAPEVATRLREGSDDLKAWMTRLTNIDWDQGDAKRGELAYRKFTCARCHEGTGRLGPDLKEIGRRFSRADLFTAILDPDRDVSPTYRVSQVVTRTGQIVVGQLVYESPETTMVQTGPDTTVRVTGTEIVEIQPSPRSPMPSGLLREATDQEVADLYAWLRVIGTPDSP